MEMTDEELRRLDELRRREIPLDAEVLRNMRAARKGLVIQQAGTIVENAVFESALGETGFMLSILIHNDSDRNTRLQGARLDIPWPVLNFRWLENPLRKIPREYTYSHPSYGPGGFDPEDVLNHRFNGRYKLIPDDWLDGLLLGAGQAPIPDQYVDRQKVPMRLTIFDGQGRPYALDVFLRMSRDRQPRRNQARKSLRTRGDLFSKPDSMESFVERPSANAGQRKRLGQPVLPKLEVRHSLS
jgi:hypothetical protein